MSKTTGKLYVITPDGSIPAVDVASPSADLKPFQKAVDGYVQPVKVVFLGKTRTAYVNKDGHFLPGLKPNREAAKLLAPAFQGQSIVGNLAIWVPDPKPAKAAPISERAAQQSERSQRGIE